MDGPPTPNARAAADDPASVLSAVAAGVLVTGGSDSGVITYANAGAAGLLGGIDPVGLRLGAVLSLAGLRNGAALAAAAQAPDHTAAIRLSLANGRPVDGSVRRLPGGEAVITLIDVSGYLEDAAQATSDTLTGLASRAHLLRSLAALLAAPGQPPVAVLCVELERFREMVESLGYTVGDILLTKVAERLRTALGTITLGGGPLCPGDMAAKIGAEEFALVQTGAPQPQAAHQLAQRVVELLARSFVVAGDIVSITAGVGVALAPADGSDAETLLQHARLALTRARSEGRGRFQFYQATLDAELQTRRSLEIELRRAQELEQLELAFQPQFALSPEALIGFEALLRWRHPLRGVIAPGVFIPLAEEIGLIVPLGGWALRTACRTAAGWPPPLTVAVNVSALQFRDSGLLAAVAQALQESGLAASRLELEITESALLDRADVALPVLQALKAMGVKISLDDFGTGYSSLGYLQKFPIDRIKIDQVFVRGSDDSADARAIVTAVTALGASLGISTLAEGVETAQQLARIRADGCDSVQGYLTGRPMDAAAVAVLLGLGAPAAAP